MAENKTWILVVDDQLGIRCMLEEVLTAAGHAVKTAASGYEALDLVKGEEPPSLILMDMKMPGLDGVETLREMAKIGLADRTVMMTAYGETGRIEQAKELGACAYVTKPFDIIVLCDMIRNFLAGQRGPFKFC